MHACEDARLGVEKMFLGFPALPQCARQKPNLPSKVGAVARYLERRSASKNRLRIDTLDSHGSHSILPGMPSPKAHALHPPQTPRNNPFPEKKTEESKLPPVVEEESSPEASENTHSQQLRWRDLAGLPLSTLKLLWRIASPGRRPSPHPSPHPRSRIQPSSVEKPEASLPAGASELKENASDDAEDEDEDVTISPQDVAALAKFFQPALGNIAHAPEPISPFEESVASNYSDQIATASSQAIFALGRASDVDPDLAKFLTNLKPKNIQALIAELNNPTLPSLSKVEQRSILARMVGIENKTSPAAYKLAAAYPHGLCKMLEDGLVGLPLRRRAWGIAQRLCGIMTQSKQTWILKQLYGLSPQDRQTVVEQTAAFGNHLGLRDDGAATGLIAADTFFRRHIDRMNKAGRVLAYACMRTTSGLPDAAAHWVVAISSQRRADGPTALSLLRGFGPNDLLVLRSRCSTYFAAGGVPLWAPKYVVDIRGKDSPHPVIEPEPLGSRKKCRPTSLIRKHLSGVVRRQALALACPKMPRTAEGNVAPEALTAHTIHEAARKTRVDFEEVLRALETHSKSEIVDVWHALAVILKVRSAADAKAWLENRLSGRLARILRPGRHTDRMLRLKLTCEGLEDPKRLAQYLALALRQALHCTASAANERIVALLSRLVARSGNETVLSQLASIYTERYTENLWTVIENRLGGTPQTRRVMRRISEGSPMTPAQVVALCLHRSYRRGSVLGFAHVDLSVFKLLDRSQMGPQRHAQWVAEVHQAFGTLVGGDSRVAGKALPPRRLAKDNAFGEMGQTVLGRFLRAVVQSQTTLPWKKKDLIDARGVPIRAAMLAAGDRLDVSKDIYYDLYENRSWFGLTSDPQTSTLLKRLRRLSDTEKLVTMVEFAHLVGEFDPEKPNAVLGEKGPLLQHLRKMLPHSAYLEAKRLLGTMPQSPAILQHRMHSWIRRERLGLGVRHTDLAPKAAAKAAASIIAGSSNIAKKALGRAQTRQAKKLVRLEAWMKKIFQDPEALAELAPSPIDYWQRVRGAIRREQGHWLNRTLASFLGPQHALVAEHLRRLRVALSRTDRVAQYGIRRGDALQLAQCAQAKEEGLSLPDNTEFVEAYRQMLRLVDAIHDPLQQTQGVYREQRIAVSEMFSAVVAVLVTAGVATLFPPAAGALALYAAQFGAGTVSRVVSKKLLQGDVYDSRLWSVLYDLATGGSGGTADLRSLKLLFDLAQELFSSALQDDVMAAVEQAIKPHASEWIEVLEPLLQERMEDAAHGGSSFAGTSEPVAA